MRLEWLKLLNDLVYINSTIYVFVLYILCISSLVCIVKEIWRIWRNHFSTSTMSKSPLDVIDKAAEEIYAVITAELSEQVTKKYNEGQWTLLELDEWRNGELPELIQKRGKEKDYHITKDELVLIMDWKLAKGKFRPTLPKLIKSNLQEDVVSVTKAGFTMFMDFAQLTKGKWNDIALRDYQVAVKASLKKLCELKGVGPATGSLLLSLLSKSTHFAAPFFSDEAFIYYIQQPLRPGSPIKYNVKEYVDEFVGVLFNIVSDRPSTSMDKLEKGAWALKMYDTYRITKLASCKLPFDVEDSLLEKFPDTQKYQPEPDAKKRKSELTKPAKRAKTAKTNKN